MCLFWPTGQNQNYLWHAHLPFLTLLTRLPVFLTGSLLDPLSVFSALVHLQGRRERIQWDASFSCTIGQWLHKLQRNHGVRRTHRVLRLYRSCLGDPLLQACSTFELSGSTEYRALQYIPNQSPFVCPLVLVLLSPCDTCQQRINGHRHARNNRVAVTKCPKRMFDRTIGIIEIVWIRW